MASGPTSPRVRSRAPTTEDGALSPLIATNGEPSSSSSSKSDPAARVRSPPPPINPPSASRRAASTSNSAMHSPTASASTTIVPTISTPPIPPHHALQHQLSQASVHASLSLRTMNSQSSLAGMATRRAEARSRNASAAGGMMLGNGKGKGSTLGGNMLGATTDAEGGEASGATTATNGNGTPMSASPGREVKDPYPSTGSNATLKPTDNTPNNPTSNGHSTHKKSSTSHLKERSSESQNPATTPSSLPQQKGERGEKGTGTGAEKPERPKFRNTPHLPQNASAERVSAAMMHWSRAPVHGFLPMRNMRAHTVTVVDHVAWVFGGCDERGCWRDVWCFDIETFQWTHPEMLGDIPPPCRAHSATLVDRKIYVWGGGEGPTYYNDLYVLDTVSHRWVKPSIPGALPLPRRAHTAVLYKDVIYVFGGGNGHRALNDVWALDTGVGVDRLRWECVGLNGSGVEKNGKDKDGVNGATAHAHVVKPAPRGYHTANLVGEVMVVMGGSDGRECFSDVWVLDLDRMVWREVRPDKTYRRLSHSSTQVGSYLFLMGGHDGIKYSHDLLLFNLVTLQFEPRQTQGRPPSSRGYHVAALADSRLWIFGGFDGHTVFDDVWVLDLAAAAYLPQMWLYSRIMDYLISPFKVYNGIF